MRKRFHNHLVRTTHLVPLWGEEGCVTESPRTLRRTQLGFFAKRNASVLGGIRQDEQGMLHLSRLGEMP